MTSPAIKAANGPKEGNGKSETPTGSEANISPAAPEQEQPTPPLTAWWRVFKLANLLMRQGC